MRFLFTISLLQLLGTSFAQNLDDKLAGKWFVCREVDLDKEDSIALQKTDTSVYHICREGKCSHTTFTISPTQNKAFVNVFHFGCASDGLAMSSGRNFEYLVDPKTGYLFLLDPSLYEYHKVIYCFSITKLTDIGLHLKRVKDQTILSKEALLSYLRNSNHIDSYCASDCECLRVPTFLYATQDSLFKHASLNEIIDYCNDSSYVVKCYSFPELLLKSEPLAFQFLKEHIYDSTAVNFFYRTGIARFNHFMIGEYLQFLKAKYYYGGMGTYGTLKRFCYQFGIRNRKLYRKKLKRLEKFLEESSFVNQDEVKFTISQ